MRKIFLLIAAICCTMQLRLASAQSAEIQQLALDMEKLTQFKQILTELKTGYQVVNAGYGTIKGLSEGTFNLHSAFLNGLLLVAPNLRSYSRVASIIEAQTALLSEYKSAYNSYKTGGRFSPSEISYMGKVYGNLVTQSLENLDELTMILTDSKLRMSDDERMRSIDRLDQQMQEKLGFLRYFNNRATSIDQKRKASAFQNEQISHLYGGR